MPSRIQCVCLIAIIFGPCLGVLFAQPARPNETWIKRAQLITDHLVSDAPRLDKTERTLMLARLADVWWKDDPRRSRAWFKRAVELVSPSANEELSETRCRLAMTRALLAILAQRDVRLNEQLLEIITNDKQNRDANDRKENADAIADAALAIVASDPETAESLAEASLRLGTSLHMGRLLWRLRASSAVQGDKLFMKALEVASTSDQSNLMSLLSLLSTAVTVGPFGADQYKRHLLQITAKLLQISATNKVVWTTAQ